MCQTICLHQFYILILIFKICEGRFGPYPFFPVWCGRIEDKLRANEHGRVISHYVIDQSQPALCCTICS
jgi:hypothetical protein